MKRLFVLARLVVAGSVLLLAACTNAMPSTPVAATDTAIPPTHTPLPTPTMTPAPTPTPTPVPDAVTITNEGNYYKVVLDYTVGKTPYEIMQEYGEKLTAALPNIQRDIDQFLYDSVENKAGEYSESLNITVPPGFESMAVGFIAEELMRRIEDVKPQLPQQYVDELEGLASTLTNTQTNMLGDGRLSKDELYFYHLLGDVGRVYQCSAVGVFGPRSATGSTLVGRNFDLDINLEGYGSVTEIINVGETHSIYLIGWLANINAYTAFNDEGVFGALVDTTGSGQPYSSVGIYSYTFDLRYALEHEATLEDVAAYLSQHPYGFNHLMFLADPEKSQVLENNLSGTGTNMRRALRSSDSELNPGITWEFDHAIVAVSAFMLKGNHDNFTNVAVATSRLQSYRALFTKAEADGVVTWDEVKSFQSYDGRDQVPGEMGDGDIYNVVTRRIVIFDPATFALEVFFAQDPVPPNDPAPFDKIPVSFAQQGQP